MRTYTTYNDTQLVLSFQDGDVTALSTLIERYKDKIYSSIFFLVKNKSLAEDIFQDTFIRVIDTLRSRRYNEEGKVLPWIMRIAHNLCVDHFRKIKRMPVITSDQSDIRDIFESTGVNNYENAEKEIIRQETNATLTDMLYRLPETQRDVIILRHFADLSFKEIARITNCSINTALGRMRYGLLNLRKMMEENSVSL
ncbi:RNA polymerase subunit sigma-24 [Arachidicoccus ginsenosidimutans]|uniref:RNA polymerase sigma factor n=1 Tax=Arachidicoccus sp. BS20 TaxID=1850526 RepID=UPI0007F1756F|nr:sigma-70 family RNA polymerase sigma factor [Arachidicoccus sp. BS20]ANI88045.1 RNA polymerase subunit sigma-24 [Arachidicoccus sp. BS20]